LSVIYITISMNKSSFPISFIVSPPSFIHRSIRPNLTTFSLSDIFSNYPVAFISCMIFKFNHSSIFNGIITLICYFIIIKLTKFFPYLLNFWIIIILLIIIFIILHVHSSIILHCSNSFSC
jgi:hypothetical protein